MRVRPVVLLAEKRAGPETPKHQPIAFVSLSGKPPDNLPHDPCKLLDGTSPQAEGTILSSGELNPEVKWTPFLYAPKVYKTLREHPGLTPLGTLARVRLGLQTLPRCSTSCRSLPKNVGNSNVRWLMPLLLSPKDFDTACLSSDRSARHYVLACNATKELLTGTRALRYVEYWENQVLTPRGQAQPVIGVQTCRVWPKRAAPLGITCRIILRAAVRRRFCCRAGCIGACGWYGIRPGG